MRLRQFWQSKFEFLQFVLIVPILSCTAEVLNSKANKGFEPVFESKSGELTLFSQVEARWHIVQIALVSGMDDSPDSEDKLLGSPLRGFRSGSFVSNEHVGWEASVNLRFLVDDVLLDWELDKNQYSSARVGVRVNSDSSDGVFHSFVVHLASNRSH